MNWFNSYITNAVDNVSNILLISYGILGLELNPGVLQTKMFPSQFWVPLFFSPSVFLFKATIGVGSQNI